MGLLDFLFSRDKRVLKEFSRLESETERLRTENENWSKSFNVVCTKRTEAEKLEKSGDLNSAMSLYMENIEYCKHDRYVNKLVNYAHDIERVIILLGKMKQTERLISFLNECISKYPDYCDIGKWKIRLSKLERDEGCTDFNLTPLQIEHPKPNSPTIGNKIRAYKKGVKEFNFYYDMQDGFDSAFYINENRDQCLPSNRDIYFSLKKEFETIRDNAEIAENRQDFKAAIELYEKMIAEETEDEYPFERLMVIYRRLKWKEQEKEIIRKAIMYFTELRDEQRIYVMSLAEKYGMQKKAMEYIGQDKKIFYYGGAFVLFNPYSRISKWKERLEKIQPNKGVCQR